MGKKNILLVEDSKGDVILIKKALKCDTDSIEVNVAIDGEEALNFLNKNGKYNNVKEPDIIILDLNLPKMNGFEILSIIKNKENLKSIPVIIFSTSSSEEDIVKSYKLAANCYLVKPVKYKDFVYIIESMKSFWIENVSYPKYH